MIKKYAAAMGLVTELIALMIAGIYAGQYLDQKNAWPGYAVTGLGLLALIVWLIHVILFSKSKEGKEE